MVIYTLPYSHGAVRKIHKGHGSVILYPVDDCSLLYVNAILLINFVFKKNEKCKNEFTCLHINF